MKTEKVASLHKQSEEAFSESEKNYRSLFEQSNDAIIIHDFKGQIIDINQRASQLLAYDREQLLSMTISMIHPESEFATSKKAFQETQKNGHARFESRLIKSDGSLVDVEISSRITDDNKEIIQGIIRDITERKQSEAALKEGESRFRALFENMINGVAVYEAINDGEDFVFVDLNKSGEKISNTTKDAVIGQGVLNLFPGIKDLGLFEIFQRVWKTGKEERYPVFLYKDDRTSHWVENSVFKLPSGEIVAVYSDRTEHKQTEKALQESEERFRQTFEQAAVGIAHVSPEGRFVRINQRFCDIVGYTIEGMKELTFQDITHPDDLELDLEYVHQVLAGEISIYSMEKRYFKKDGSIVWVNLTVSLVRKSSGEPKYFISVVEDITDRKWAEEALKESEERLKSFYNAAFQGISISEQGKIVDFNRQFSAIFGYERDELIGREVMDLVAEEDRESVLNNIRSGFNKPYEHKALKKDGSIIFIEVHGQKIQFQGRPARVTAIHDLTERIRAEDALRESESRYRALTENMAEGVCIFQDMKLVFLNPAFTSTLGYTDEELLGIDPMVLFHSDYKNRFKKSAEALEKDATVLDFQAICIRKDGLEIWIEAYHSVIQWKEKPALLITIRDITETKSQEIAAEEDRRQLQKENIKLRASIKDRYKFGDIIGKSPAMQDVYELILKAASSDINVAILGESGTGKELVARAIHDAGVRADKIFVPVNCGAIPENLAETELFGHRKGAFTGAHIDKNGYLHTASGGTLFLDEVAELEPNIQVKLLRAIETGEYTPVGDTRPRKSDLRIISATNRDLSEMIAKGLMREDFYYRISIIPITLPPLRERKQDIPLLVEHFIKLHSNGKKYPIISGTTMKALIDYDWPGNVRELQSMIQRYLAVGYFHFLKSHNQTDRFKDRIDFNPDEDVMDLRQSIEQCEKRSIFNALHKYQWQRGETAAALGIDPKTLYSKIKKFGFYRDYRAIMPDLN